MPWPPQGLYADTPRRIRVYLRKNTWFNHICAYHPELNNCLDDVMNTISDPEAIYDDDGAYVSYRYSEKRGKYIMVIYHIVGRVGRVKTAYAVNDPIPEIMECNKVYPR
jgi:hypothetical protein